MSRAAASLGVFTARTCALMASVSAFLEGFFFSFAVSVPIAASFLRTEALGLASRSAASSGVFLFFAVAAEDLVIRKRRKMTKNAFIMETTDPPANAACKDQKEE